MPKKAPESVQTTDKAAELAATEARAEERTRVSEINALCGKFEMDKAFIATAIDDGLTVSAVNALILDQKYQASKGATLGHVELTEGMRQLLSRAFEQSRSERSKHKSRS